MRASASIVSSLLFVSCAGRAPETPPPVSAQLESFEYAWARVGEAHPYADMGGVDWDAVRAELLPEAEAADSAAALRPVLQEMFDRLGDSHYAVVPADVYDEMAVSSGEGSGGAGSETGYGGSGVEPAWIEGAVRALRVDGPAADAGLAPGWELLQIDDLDVPALVASLAETDASPRQQQVWSCARVQAALSGAPGETRTIRAAAAGEEIEIEVALTEEVGVPAKLGELPEILVDFEARELPEARAGYVRFNVFMMPVPQDFAAALPSLREAPGLVIDLRGNPGGVVSIARGISNHLVDAPGSLGTMITRAADLSLTVNPRLPEQRFDGPVAVLVDGRSGSTSEIMAAGLQEMGRARVFGETSAGMALPSVFEVLPNGDRIQFAFADLTTPGGHRIEGVGVAPDEPVAPTAEALLAGRDPVLEAALAWIDGAAE